MSYYPDIHTRSASEEVAIDPHDFQPISNALNYAARVVMASNALIDVESTSLVIKCGSAPEGMFDGVSVAQGMNLTSQQIVDGDAVLSLSLYGRRPGEVHTFRSLPEGSGSTATTTFIELVGPDQDLTHTYKPDHIATLLDQTLGTSESLLFSQIACHTADKPFHEFVSSVTQLASRFAKTKHTEQEYHGDTFAISSTEIPAGMNKAAEQLIERAPQVWSHLQQTEATLSIIRDTQRTVDVRSTLSAPMTIDQYLPAIHRPSYSDGSTTLRETFEVTTPLINPRNLRALIRPVIDAKLRVENIGGLSLGRPDDLYMYAKDAADHVDEPLSLVQRSLKILSDHKELGLVDLH